MTDRNAALADIYGADRSRWPAEDRAVEADIPAHAVAVDRLLDAYAVSAPSSALIGQIIASAHPRRLWSQARIWWSGLGLAGIGLAGAVAGALAITVALPAMAPHHGTAFAEEQATVFDSADVEGSEL